MTGRPTRTRLIENFRVALAGARGRWTELLLVGSYVGGWALITWGLARLLVPEVWLLSGGVLLLSAGGLGLLKDVATEGLYVLSRAARRKDGS